MNKFIVIVLPMMISGAFPAPVLSQGFFEYGRAVGSVPHGQGITGGKASGGTQQGSGTVGGIGDVGGRSLPTRLVVAAKTTGLYPSQDEETEKIEQLSQGDALSPMVQSAGNNGTWLKLLKAKSVG